MLLCKLGYTTGFSIIAFIGFDFIFMILWLLLYSICILLTYHLCSIPSISYSYHIIPCMFLLDVTYYLSTCSSMPVLMTRFSMHVYDSDLSIYMCLSLHTTWHSPYHSLGSSHSPGSSCPGLRTLSLWILPVADQSSTAPISNGISKRFKEFELSKLIKRVELFPGYKSFEAELLAR